MESMSGTLIVDLLANDTIILKPSQNSGGGKTLESNFYNSFNVWL